MVFTKMHGCGNDYIYIDTTKNSIADPEAFSLRWSDRHKGIGSDGIVLIGRPNEEKADADFTMRIFNADGSEAMMCGNASRCVGKYLYECGLTDKTTIRLLTRSGVKTLSLHVTDGIVGSVTVDMGEPVMDDISSFIPSQLDNVLRDFSHGRKSPNEGVFVSMGNPHFVIFTEKIDDVVKDGQRLEYHSAFPQRCNIEYAHVQSDESIRVRVWERGSGITQACGTGACATAVAACVTGRTGRHSRILMDGGTLDVFWNEKDNHVYMTGPAEFVFDGEVNIQE